MEAVAGARHGLRTVLLEPGRHVGGMATGGLSRSDVGKREVLGGLAAKSAQMLREFGGQVTAHRARQPSGTMGSFGASAGAPGSR